MGNVFIEEIQEWITHEGLTGISVDSNYQLNIEDAEAISHQDIVVFIDASIEEIDDFILTRVEASGAKIEFTMHAVSAAFILDLCQKLYERYPATFLLHIRGYKWEMKEGLTSKARRNLRKALDFMKVNLRSPENFKTYLK